MLSGSKIQTPEMNCKYSYTISIIKILTEALLKFCGAVPSNMNKNGLINLILFFFLAQVEILHRLAGYFMASKITRTDSKEKSKPEKDTEISLIVKVC